MAAAQTAVEEAAHIVAVATEAAAVVAAAHTPVCATAAEVSRPDRRWAGEGSCGPGRHLLAQEEEDRRNWFGAPVVIEAAQGNFSGWVLMSVPVPEQLLSVSRRRSYACSCRRCPRSTADA